MPVKSYKCRFCGEPFVPTLSNKPGYIDECPDCFYARTHPTPADDVISRLERRSPEIRRTLNSLLRRVRSREDASDLISMDVNALLAKFEAAKKKKGE
jgi:DNA-directed RNA polymerase subunit RPC12/RpoP